MTELQNFCKVQGLAMPRYEHHVNAAGFIVSIVHIGHALVGGRPGAHANALGAWGAYAYLIAFLAVAAPTWGNAENTGGPRGVDLVVCLDVSRSMLARDQAPSRLAVAQDAITDLAERARGDRIGLVRVA